MFDFDLAELYGYEVVGQATAEAREEKGMSQRDLSSASGVMQADISKIEKGKGNPTLITLQKIAKSLGRTLASLMLQLTKSFIVTRILNRNILRTKKRTIKIMLKGDSIWSQSTLAMLEMSFIKLQILVSNIMIL